MRDGMRGSGPEAPKPPAAEQAEAGVEHEIRGAESVDEHFFREASVDLAAREEEEFAEILAEARGGGVMATLNEHRRWVMGFVLASMVAGGVRSLAERQVEDVGSKPDAMLMEALDAIEAAGPPEVPTEAEAREAMRTEPGVFLATSIDTVKDAPYAGELFVDYAETSPETFSFRMGEFEGQAYAGEVAEALFLSAPFSVNRYMHNPIDDRDRAASAVLISAIESSENPDVELMQSLLEAVGDDPHLRPALNVLPYIIDQGWDAQTAVQELQDDDQMIEALLASIELGNSKQAERAESHLSQKADGDVNEMNLRKGRADRFESLEGASATELYATIVYGGRDARESTIKPLFSMLENGIRTSDQTPVEFLDSVDGVGFHEFATLAALHGRFDNFLRLARTAEDKQAITDRLMTFSTDQGAEQVTALSQMILFGKDASVRRLLVDGLADTYADSEKMANPETAAAVTLLSATLGEEATWIEEGDRVEFEKKEFLSSAELVNDRGETIEVQHFYSDLDGEYSYESFLKQFLGSDWKIQEIPSLADATSGGSEEVYMAAGWGIVDHGTFVEVTSTGDGNKMVFYANKPSAAFGEKEGSRFEAWQEAGSPLGMDDVQVHMEANDRSPHIEVHRGHSYWFGNTLDQLSLDTKLVFNGSCGGADEVDDILEKAPGAQVVYNSDEGWAIINDAMLSEINERVVSGGDIVWEDVRMGAEDRLERHQKSGSSRPDLMSKYMSYVYPDQQLGQAANIGSLYEDMIAVL